MGIESHVLESASAIGFVATQTQYVADVQHI